MTKRAISLCVLAGLLLAVLTIYVLVVLLPRGQGETAADDTNTRLFPIDTASVIGLRWNYAGETIELIRGDDAWHWTGDENCPIDSEKVTELITCFSETTAIRVVDANEGEAQYGLDPPAYEYALTLANGSTLTLYLGDYSSYAQGYYAGIAGEDAVYVVDELVVSDFSCGIMDMLKLEETPDLSRATQMTVKVDGRELSLRYFADSSGMSYSDSYHWFVQSANGRKPASAGKMEELLGKLVNINWLSCISYNATQAQLEQYGIDPDNGAGVTVGYSDERGVWSNFTLLFGDYKDGVCYANIEGSGMLYTISGIVADAFILLGEEDIAATELCMVDLDRIMSISVAVGDRQATIDYAGEETSAGEDGELISVPVWQRGGVKLDSAVVSAFTDAFMALQTEGEIGSGRGRQELMRVTLELKNEDVLSLTFVTYSSTQTAAIRGDGVYLVSADAAAQLSELALALCPEGT